MFLSWRPLFRSPKSTLGSAPLKTASWCAGNEQHKYPGIQTSSPTWDRRKDPGDNLISCTQLVVLIALQLTIQLVLQEPSPPKTQRAFRENHSNLQRTYRLNVTEENLEGRRCSLKALSRSQLMLVLLQTRCMLTATVPIAVSLDR